MLVGDRQRFKDERFLQVKTTAGTGLSSDRGVALTQRNGNYIAKPARWGMLM